MKIYQDLVTHFGNQHKTAKALDVSQPSVNAWVLGKTSMSALVALKAEKATQGIFKAQDLCLRIKNEVSTVQ